MSKNLTRKGLALGTAVAFAVTGLTATAPAYAAAGDVVSITETSGTGFAAYDTDTLSVDVNVNSDVVTAASYEKLALNIANPESLNVTVGASDGETTSELSYYLFDSLGNKSAEKTSSSNVLDFTQDSKEYTSAVIDLEGVAVADSITVTLSAAGADTDNANITVTAFIDDSDNTFESTDIHPSKATAVTFYDPTAVTVTPRIERFVGATNTYLNGHGGKLGASLTFSPALNTDQVDLTEFSFTGTTAGSANGVDGFTAEYLDGATAHAGRIYGELEDGGVSLSLAKGSAYKFVATRDDITKDYTSSSYTPAGQQDTTTDITAIDDSTVGSAADTAQTGNDVIARAGVKSLTYTAAADEAKAGVVAYAVVTATDLVTGSTLTVGSKSIKEGESALVSGATNAKGEFAVTVESSSAKAGENYDITFSVLKLDGSFATDTVAVDYETAAAENTLTVDSEILSGSSVTAKVTIEDQFGTAASTTSAGKALYVRFNASTTTNLDKYVAVAAGAASVTFTNYIAKGNSDSITATLGTGGANSTDFSTAGGYSDTATFSLYNPEAADAISTDAVLADKKVTYDAFITGTASATNVAPTEDEGHTLAGTVVDAAGVGIPGAVVTVAASGLQFVKLDSAGEITGSYYKDTITVSADSAGAYSVKAWAHKVSSTGITVTTTSGGKTATTKLTTTGRNNIAADDLVLTWDAPKHPRVDTTYITTVKLTDKWGNPLSGANLTIEAAGALLINGGDTVTKTTSAAGVVRVYFRSIAKTDGIANLTATLNSVTVDSTSVTVTGGETFENVLSSDVVVGADAVAVAGKKAGTAKVVAYNASGKTATVYVNGKKVATKKLASSRVAFAVNAKAGATVKVMIGTSTFFNGVAY